MHVAFGQIECPSLFLPSRAQAFIGSFALGFVTAGGLRGSST